MSVLFVNVLSNNEVGVLFVFMIIIGMFGAINSAIASFIALPKSCKSRFDNMGEKEHDYYQGLSSFRQ